MLTKALALELASHGIRVNAVAPGSVDTEASRELDAMRRAGSVRNDEALAANAPRRSVVPLGGQAQPDQVARAIVFLGSDFADYVTGALLLIDGGALLT
jgi:NAD(P)-dependent dehydrogenase (short-subunit alcohol dehydrogenase family)